MENQQLENLFFKHELKDFKWVSGKDIKVAQWVRMKCMFGCDSYGKNSICPPNVPTVSECRTLFSEFESAVIFRFIEKFDEPEQMRHWRKIINNRLIKLEKEIFLAGNHKAFVLYISECSICSSCVEERSECRNKKNARPCVEALAVDVYGTVRSIGYPIKVVAETTEEINRYAILLIE